MRELVKGRLKRFTSSMQPEHAEKEWADWKRDAANRNATERAELLIAQAKIAKTGEDADRVRGVYLFGGNGSGKTQLAALIGKDVLRGDKTAGYCEWPMVLAEIRDTFNGNDPQATEMRIVDRLCAPWLLVVDEVDKGKASDFAGDLLYRVINERWGSKLCTVFTSNLSPRDVAGRLGENGRAIESRIMGSCDVISMGGSDRRVTKV